MNASLLIALIPMVVGTDLLAYPQLSGEALQAQVEGDVRHAARVALGKAGFLVDLLWNEARIQAGLRLAVQNQIAQAQAQQDAGGASAPQGAPPEGAIPAGGTVPPAGVIPVPAGSIATLPYVTFIDPPR